MDTKNHAIVKELTRVKQYFEKIQKIENPPAKPENTLNTEAAIRFVRSNLVSEAFLLCLNLLTVYRAMTRKSMPS